MKELNFKNAILAGVIGTIMFDVFGWIMMGQWWDIPALLSDKMSAPLVFGVFSHYVNGIAMAVLFAMVQKHLIGPSWIRPFLFITIQTVVIVWLFMFPMLGAGIGGVNMGPMTPIASLMRHWIYVVPFVFLIKPTNQNI